MDQIGRLPHQERAGKRVGGDVPLVPSDRPWHDGEKDLRRDGQVFGVLRQARRINATATKKAMYLRV